VIEIVDRAVEAGVYEEAYRAVVNFIWSASGYLHLDEIERVIVMQAERAVAVAPPSSIGPYLELSTVFMLWFPAGRWDEVDELMRVPDELATNTATSRLVWLGLVGGMTLRRGDLQAAASPIEELQPKALASGEMQRIVPMACVALPLFHLTGKSDELRALAEEVLTTLDGRWPSVLTAVPVVRTLAAAGEAELLQRTIDSMRRMPSEIQTAKLGISLTAGEGLLALLQGRADEAVERLTAAIEAERELGYVYDAACLELDLARALEAAGRAEAAAEARSRAASVLEPLGCVNAF
jgi:ATP/maltotriose-dependent transcriptional regulator MalT